MLKNIFAYTETNWLVYPGFVSINEDEMGRITVTLRSADEQHAKSLALPKAQLTAMARAILQEVA